MTSLHDLVFPYYNKVLQRNSNWLFSGVLSTPPMPSNPNGGTILYTPLGRRDRRAYILAVKSLLRFSDDLRVVLQNDGTLDEAACAEIRAHIPGIDIRSAAEMDEVVRQRAHPDLYKYLPQLLSPTIPTNHKIIKLKLLNILYQFRGKRVFMIDSDIICCRSPTFILEWMKDTQPSYFYGGGGNAQTQAFHDLGYDFSRVDIGNFNSGIMGLCHDVEESELLEILERIHQKNPSLMTGWEIEQSLWSVLFAKRTRCTNVDAMQEGYITSGWKTYQRMKERAVFVHFVGAIRFRSLRYWRLASDVYADLRARAAR